MVIDNLIALLSELCNKVIQQGSLAPDAEYPPKMFTFWQHTSDDYKHYDNKAYGCVWVIDVNYYSTDPLDVYNTLEQARQKLLQNGWRISGKGHDVASDNTTHTGRGFTATYIEN